MHAQHVGNREHDLRGARHKELTLRFLTEIVLAMLFKTLETDEFLFDRGRSITKMFI